MPVHGRCSSGFGPRQGEFHAGQDLAAGIGTPIMAASNGTVIDSGPVSGYGLWVRIQHPDGVVSTYGHNRRNLVQPGQPIQAGQLIAEVGDRGESTGPHVHFQLERVGEPVDPVAFYRQQAAPALCRDANR
ncbi:M23 family metallopeptidase [Saccharopolyspora sp. NFXS83]|uniref:M23 family metallopeptidase n=1 Tax=Saccharopolyspora sp. NFXS83 TaxID=2993560 RepID=UPI00224AA6C5|nr:M23 family metallopeptidase [Saccharopolyspora sp. NFXS83]MCX2730578.1 M23 family metallopeptidase [Saccharopolyspora sp. NFXS83]